MSLLPKHAAIASLPLEQLAGGHLSHDEVAGMVRMLMRDQIDHEAVCTVGRDRIAWLAGRVEKLESELAALAGGGEAVAQLTTFEDTNSFSARMHDVVHDLPPGTYNLYLHPAGAVQVTDAQCEAVYQAVTMANLTRDVKYPERKQAIVRNALNPGDSRE